MSIEQDLAERRTRANEARQFMQNPLFDAAFDGVAEDLEQVALSCDPDNKDKSQRVIIAKQLLQAVKREIIRRVEDGEFAQFQMKELDKRSRLRLFQR